MDTSAGVLFDVDGTLLDTNYLHTLAWWQAFRDGGQVGDTAWDIKAARSAGLPCVAVRCGGLGADELRDAVAVYDDPADLLRNLAASPIAAAAAG